MVERQVATTFLRWFVIQIAAYGLFALGAALLNTRRRFVAVAWAPIVNNLVCIGVLIWFGLWAGHGASLASVEQHRAQLVLLGLGTSLGVVLQGVALVPSLRRADLGLLRWHWNPRDDALRAVTRLGGWTFGFVVANQLALFVVTVLIWFGLWAGHGASLASVEQHKAQLVLLGLGTSLGVVLQGVALVPSLRRADLGLLRWRWNPRDDAVRAVARLGAWTFGFVLATQIAVFIVTVLAGTVPGPDPVSSYTYAYPFLQLPYGIVAVTIMSVVTPDLAERWSTGQLPKFIHRLATGLRAVLALIIPAAVGLLLLAKPAVALLLGNGHSTPTETATTGAALAMFALGLPGFCAFLYQVRVLQAMQRSKVAFFLYLVEVPLNVVLALILVHPLGVRGLALSLSISYTVAAVVAFATFRHWFGTIGTAELWAPLWRVVIASVPMAIVVLVVSNLSGSTSVVGLLGRVVLGTLCGALTFGAVVIWLGRRDDLRRRRRDRDEPRLVATSTGSVSPPP